MTDPKDFIAGVGSDIKTSQKRVLFVTRRTSAHVKSHDEEQVQTYPEALIRALLAVELLTIVLVSCRSSSTRRWRAWRTPPTRRIPPRRPGIFWGCRNSCIIFPPWSPAC